MLFVAKKAKPGKQPKTGVLAKLDNYINAASPELVYWLCRIWDDQQQAVTYKELQEAIAHDGLEAQIQQWQEDYAVFVNEHLRPVWLAAMTAAAQDISSRHNIFIFDDSSVEVQNWIRHHGADFVTMVSNDVREAVNAIVTRGTAERWSSVETAKTLRATIGLNGPQAIANVNYYQNTLEQLKKDHPRTPLTKLEAEARLRAARMGGRQHRCRAQMIASTETAFAYNKGEHESVRQAMAQGLMGPCVKKWRTSRDERVCKICGGLNGAVIGFDEDFDFPTKLTTPEIKRTPPAHPNCRCAVAYEETAPPKFVPADLEPLTAWNGEKILDLPDPPAAGIPGAVPMPHGMKDKGLANVGGTGEIHRCVDSTGKEWLFKPAQDKGGYTSAPFRAYAQEAAYRLQGIVDAETAVQVGVGDISGSFGAFQEMVQTQAINKAKSWQQDLRSGTFAMVDEISAAAPQIQREHVTDWLLCNFDAHAGNFLTRQDGVLIGIDKEQAFKYIAKDGAKEMGYKFHPNKVHGEIEPIYNNFFEAFAKGKLDINPQDSLPFIKRVEAIPDTEYREIFRNYAEALKGKGQAAESLLDDIVERKATLRETYRKFYSDLLTERTGKKQVFVFADESAAVNAQPLAAKVHDAATLAKMNKQELLQIAKNKQIAYYNNMSKQQLVTAIADPAKAKEMSQQVKERLEAARVARAKKPKAVKKPGRIVDVEDLLDDLSIIPDDRQGIAVRADAGNLERMNLTARREHVAGTDYIRLYGKITEEEFKHMAEAMKNAGARRGKLQMNAADNQAAVFYKNENQGIMQSLDVDTLRVDFPHGKAELVDIEQNTSNALNGYFSVLVPADARATANLKNILQDLDAGWVMKNPTDKAELLYKKRAVAWQHSPEFLGKDIAALSEKKLDDLLQQKGINAARFDKMHPESTWKGYISYIDEEAIAEAKALGVEYIWSAVTRAESVAAVIKSGGFACTKNRVIMGAAGDGASMVADFGTGGADSVFTRLGVKHKTPRRFADSSLGGGYRIKMRREILGRTDWYAYTGDEFGTTEPSTFKKRQPLKDFVKAMKRNWRSGNEIMFRNGIRSEEFIGINCDTPEKRQTLLDVFAKEGIKEVNGVPVEKFVTVESRVGY